MTQASTTSPFVIASEDAPWLIWQKNTPITALCSEVHTDGRSVNEAIMNADTPYQPVHPSYRLPPIQRAQYNAVLNRISQASHRTGQYSTWST